MATTVRDLMSTPALTCPPALPLTAAAASMRDAGVGSLVVTDGPKVVGILTERDVLRSAAAGADQVTDPVHLWMTAQPDVLGPDEEVAAAWSSLSHHHYRHLPVVDGDVLVGVVSLRDLVSIASLRPGGEPPAGAPRGLEGVVVAETAVGGVRGLEGFFHYRQYSAVDLAATRSLEDVWQLLVDGELPDRRGAERFGARVRELRPVPDDVLRALPTLSAGGNHLSAFRTILSLLGGTLGWAPTLDIDHATLRDQALHVCALAPTLMAAIHRTRSGLEPVAPRDDLSYGANYLWMLTGREADPRHARAIEQYMILTIDHGFNASTFAARVIASTGADLAAALCGAVGALSGPLHGGAPSRALSMLDAIGSVSEARPWLEAAMTRGERIMGFGHRVYKTDDPRSVFLRDVARDLGGPLFDKAAAVEQTAVEVLSEQKPGRRLYTNVEFYAGVVMDTCGVPRPMFTPTFAASRCIGWTTHVLEQAADNRLIRPDARYVGPPPPEPLPAA